MHPTVVLLAVGAAIAYAVAANLKHASAHEVPDASDLGRHAVARFVRATLTHRLFLLSLVVDVVGAGLQILALRRGALAVVQPLLVSGLVIALALRIRAGGGVRRLELLWAAVLAASLAAFLGVAGVTTPVGATVDVRPAAVLGAVGVLVAVVCVGLARRRRSRGGSAALVGVAVGVVDASTAALLKSLTTIAGRGVLAVATSWQLYLLIVLVAAAMFLNQLAFQAGPLAASLPMISSVDPLVSTVIGVVVFDETIRHGPVAVVALVGSFAALVSAVVVLSRGDRVATVTPPVPAT